MDILPIKTRPIMPPQDDLFAVLDEYVPMVHERDLIVITSKVVSIHEGRCISVEEGKDKEEIMKTECDAWLSHPQDSNRVGMAIVHNAVVPFAGVDESNASGFYVLLPKDPHASARAIRAYLMERDGLSELAVIIADSTFAPLRAGNVSFALGFAGLVPVRDYRGKPDLFGREQKLTQSNRIDPLAALAGYAMGEGDESTPIVILRDVPDIEFTNEDLSDMVLYPFEQDFYREALKVFRKA